MHQSGLGRRVMVWQCKTSFGARAGRRGGVARHGCGPPGEHHIRATRLKYLCSIYSGLDHFPLLRERGVTLPIGAGLAAAEHMADLTLGY
jgi:hypothetical protein